MKLGVLFSGGKDSTLALHTAAATEDIRCLISVSSQNRQSYMFHTPNIHLVTLQAKAMTLPLIKKETEGKPEKELEDLKEAIRIASRKYSIDGIVSGAIESVYQTQRIQSICNRLELWCFNPLWKRNQKELLLEMVEKRFRVIISGVFAYPLDEDWLGLEINNGLIEKLATLKETYGLSPSGEGGEIETTVLDAPLFKKKLEIVDSEIEAADNTGILNIKKVQLKKK